MVWLDRGVVGPNEGNGWRLEFAGLLLFASGLGEWMGDINQGLFYDFTDLLPELQFLLLHFQ